MTFFPEGMNKKNDGQPLRKFSIICGKAIRRLFVIVSRDHIVITSSPELPRGGGSGSRLGHSHKVRVQFRIIHHVQYCAILGMKSGFVKGEL